MIMSQQQQENMKKEKEKKKSYKGTVWFSLRRSMQCKSEPSEVHSPKTTTTTTSSSKNRKHHHHLNAILMTTRGKQGGTRSGCSRSISNLRDVVIHGSKRHLQEKGGGTIISCSPRSIGSNELLNPITHEVVLRNNSRCELRITSFGGFQDGLAGSFVGTLRPGTPGPAGAQNLNPMSSPPPLVPRRGRGRRTSWVLGDNNNSSKDGSGFSSKGKAADVNASSSSSSSSHTCHRCGEEFGKWEALEVHHLSHHAVTELMEGDSSRKIVEIICRSSWLKSESRPPGGGGRMIDRVLKVHNTQKTLACFEEYRETVKAKAGKLPKKHPRCLADGNELLRFHGTTVSCPLGTGGSHSLCTSQRCRVCHIIRNGFSMEKDPKNGIGVFTTSTSGRAFESIELQHAAGGDDDDEQPLQRKALVVCRVIAGRVHRPLENVQEMAGQTGFDSLAGKVGLYSNIEELYLLNPRALLPCFVVICKS